MKLYISADIEGVCGIVDWNETFTNNSEWENFRIQMSKEVASVCIAAYESGFDEIIIKDAHEDGRNIIYDLLPKFPGIKLIRGWTEDPLCMMSCLDSSFDAVAFVGYHSGAFSNGNPLSHTMYLKFDYIKINGVFVSEFIINAFTSAYFDVPVVFLSGDKALCESAKNLNKNISTVSVLEGNGGASISIHPEIALELIKNNVKSILSSDFKQCKINLPNRFEIEIRFKEHKDAHKASFYPNMLKKDVKTVIFNTDNYFEFLRMMIFI